MKTSRKDNLGDGLKDYYQNHSLSNQSIQSLLTQTVRPTTSWVHRPAVWVASFFVVLMLGQFLYFEQSHQKNLTTLVLEEIAMNHNKKLNAEYVETRTGQLRAEMRRLDFSLDLPADIQRDFQLIGGRYCSIQGGLAAQLKVRNNANGKIATLYVTTLTEKLKRITQQTAAQDDVKIRVWQQQGRFFGLATDLP